MEQSKPTLKLYTEVSLVIYVRDHEDKETISFQKVTYFRPKPEINAE